MLVSTAPAPHAAASESGAALPPGVLPIEPVHDDETFALTHSTSSSAAPRAPDRAARRVISSLAQYRSSLQLGRHLQRGGERRAVARPRPRALLADSDRWGLPVAVVWNSCDRTCAIAVPDTSIHLHSYDAGGALGQLLVHESLFWGPDGRLAHCHSSLPALFDYFISGEALTDFAAIESVVAACGTTGVPAANAETGAAATVVDQAPVRAAPDASGGASAGADVGGGGSPLAGGAPAPSQHDGEAEGQGRLWRRLRRRLQEAIRKDRVALLSCTPAACWKPR